MKTAEVFFNESLEFLKDNGIEFKPNQKALKLRLLAIQYVDKMIKRKEILAIFLTGSSVIGNSGKGSDLDIEVIISGNTKPLQKHRFKGIPVDSGSTAINEWQKNSSNGESIRFLSHSIPLFIRKNKILKIWQNAIKKYCSENNYQNEYKRVAEIVAERSNAIEYFRKHDKLFLAMMPIESCFIEVVNLLKYKHKGCPSISTMLEELNRISFKIGKKVWFSRALKFMRFDLKPSEYRKLLQTYRELFRRMRGLVAENNFAINSMKKLDMGWFNAGKQINELISEINEKQLIDKIERSIGRKQPFNAGLSLLFETHYNFFMFTPFFWLKNIDDKSSEKTIEKLPFTVGFEVWDADIKKMWIALTRANKVDEKIIQGLNKLNHEILAECKP